MGGSVLEWIISFLHSRRQQVGGMVSSWLDVLSGVPQGSVLGPVLFICYINDMPDLITSFLYMYAHDAKLFNRVSDQLDVSSLQADLDILYKHGQLSGNYDST